MALKDGSTRASGSQRLRAFLICALPVWTLYSLVGAACPRLVHGDRFASDSADAQPRVVEAHAIEWTTRASGVRVAVLYGDPALEGPFVLRLEYPPGYEKGPHYHPGDALITVLDGGYSRGYGATFNRNEAYDLVPGTFSLNPRGVSHYEWTRDGATLQVFAVGPWSTVYVDGEDRAIDPSGPRPVANDAPHVLSPDAMQWSAPDASTRTALLYGNSKQPGPFTLRLEFSQPHRKGPHTHATDAYVTVLSGALNLGFGTAAHDSAAVKLAAGSFAMIPAGVPHYEWNSEPTLVEVHASGPWESLPVLPPEGTED